jgi:hypothetical protein
LPQDPHKNVNANYRLNKDTHSEWNIVYLKDRKGRIEETNTAGKINYLSKSHNGETVSRLSKMRTAAVGIKHF